MGRVVHFEIHADDLERAATFYSGTFGWRFQRWEGPSEYWLIETGSTTQPTIDGGLVRRETPLDGDAIAGFGCTVNVESIDEIIEKIKKYDGQVITPKISLPGIGWLIYFKDTEGNMVGAMQSDPNAR